MKKIFLTAAVLTAAASVSVYPEKLTIKNTIGSDLDTLGEYDFYSHTKQKVYSASGDTISENDICIIVFYQIRNGMNEFLSTPEELVFPAAAGGLSGPPPREGRKRNYNLTSASLRL